MPKTNIVFSFIFGEVKWRYFIFIAVMSRVVFLFGAFGAGLVLIFHKEGGGGNRTDDLGRIWALSERFFARCCKRACPAKKC